MSPGPRRDRQAGGGPARNRRGAAPQRSGARSGAARSVKGVRRGPKATDSAGDKHSGVHLADDLVRELMTSARPGKGEILVKVFADAMGAYATGELEEAIRLGDQAKHMALRAPSVREFLGLAYYSARRWKEAARELGAFRRMSGSSSQNPVIADCYRATGKPEKAVELCDEIEKGTVEPQVYFEGQIVAASAQADMGRLDDAIRRLEALDLEPRVAEEHHVRVWYVLADLLEKKGRYTQARMWFKAVLAAEPDLTDAAERLGRLEAKSGD